MSAEAIDRAVYAELQETLGAEFAAELVTTFLQEAPQMLAELRDATATGDAEAFRRAAHSIKSNAAIFGAAALAAAARDLELGGIDPEGIAALDAAYARADAALRGLLDG